MFLIPHPDLPHPELDIEVEVDRGHGGRLALVYLMVSDSRTRIRLPKRRGGGRADELWEHSCFEAFVRVPGEAGYWEFNFSPSSQWAAYRLDSYRGAMRHADLAAPSIEIPENRDAFEVRVEIQGLPADRPWQVGLSAVIEETNGRKSWWALAHPPGEPDFHHPDCFALDLPAAP